MPESTKDDGSVYSELKTRYINVYHNWFNSLGIDAWLEHELGLELTRIYNMLSPVAREQLDHEMSDYY